MEFSPNSNLPLVSIITAVYNGEKYFEETIQSIMNQNYSCIEYIIIDGGSTDGTLKIVKKYAEKLAYWVSAPDMGIYDAWNKALKVARGEWMVFVGSDDLLLIDGISSYINYIQAQKGAPLDFVSSRVELVTADLSLKRIWGSAWKWSQFRRYMNVAHVGSFHHYTLFEKYGFFDIKYKVAADYEFLLRPGSQLRTGYFNKITAKMRIGGASLSHKNVFYETLQAKLDTAKRKWIVCYYEFLVARLKFETRRILNFFII